jgi:hypothetical protein
MTQQGKLWAGIAGGFALALSIALLSYPIAGAYHAGYIRQLGLPPGLLPLSYESSTSVSVVAVSIFGATVAVGLVFILTAFFRHVVGRVVQPVAQTTGRELFFKVVPVVAPALAVLVLSLEAAAYAGATVATMDDDCPKSLPSATPGHCAQLEFELVDNAPSIHGHLIGCSERHCVLRTESAVVVLRREEIQRTTTLNP